MAGGKAAGDAAQEADEAGAKIHLKFNIIQFSFQTYFNTAIVTIYVQLQCTYIHKRA